MSVQLLVCPFHSILYANAGRPLDHQRGLKFLFEKPSRASSFGRQVQPLATHLRGSCARNTISWRDHPSVQQRHLVVRLSHHGRVEEFFCFWPCPYCGSSRHTLPKCHHLHLFCQICNSRGHAQTPECESPMPCPSEQKFKVFNW